MAKKYYLDGRVFKPRNGVRVTTFLGQEDPVSLNEIIEEVVGVSLPVVPATTTVQGIVELATNAEAIAKTSTTVVLTPSNLAALGASTTFAGLTEFSTDVEALAKVSTTTALTPSNLAALGATETFAGLAELATDAEAIAGVSTTTVVTPANLAATIAAANLGPQALDDVLLLGNFSGGTSIEMSSSDVIRAVDGGGELNLWDGADNTISLTTDNGVYAEGWFYADTAVAQLGYSNVSDFEVGADYASMYVTLGTTFTSLSANGIISGPYANEATVVKTIAIGDPSAAPVSFNCYGGGSAVSINSGDGVNPTVFNTLSAGSVALGGIGITVKTNNTAYANQLALNASGSTFETLIDTATLTADRTAEFPDTSGVISIIRTVTTAVNYNAQNGEIVLGTSGGGGITVTLPDTTGKDNMQITVKKVDAGGGAFNINSAGGLIDGAAGAVLAAQYDGLQFTSNGGAWWVTGSF